MSGLGIAQARRCWQLQTHLIGPPFLIPALNHCQKISKNFGAVRVACSAADRSSPPVMDHSSLVNSVLGIIPELTNDKYKGQAGKVAVIGGCREYTGAPFFASYSALKVGADLSHVFCTPGAAAVIKTYSPELIVHPYLPDTADDEGAGIEEGGRLRDRAVSAVLKWLDRFDVLVVGPGLGRDDVVLSTVASIMEEARRKNIPMVIDADGLWLVNHWPELVRGYQSAILTPNAAEFRRLLAKLEVEEGEGAAAELARKLGGPVVVRKGSDDVISDGSMEIKCSVRGSLRRAGGQVSTKLQCGRLDTSYQSRRKNGYRSV